MSVSLEEALQEMDLKPGQTHRCLVKGRLVEVRIVDEASATEVPGDPWTELRHPEPTGTATSRLAPPPPVDIPEIPPEGE